MAECCRTIVLDEKVRKPCKRVRHHKCGQDQPRSAEHDRQGQQQPARERADGVKVPRKRLTVRQNIERPELRKTPRLIHGAHCSSQAIRYTLRKLSRPAGGRRRGAIDFGQSPAVCGTVVALRPRPDSVFPTFLLRLRNTRSGVATCLQPGGDSSLSYCSRF